MYTIKSVNAGEVIIAEGTIQPNVFILKSGKLEVTKSNLNSTSKLGEVNPGEFVGEMAHLGAEKMHHANVVAMVDSELIAIPAENFFDVLCANPVWLKALLRSFVKRIEDSNQNKVQKISFKPQF